ncbi:MAG: hypothetical protein SFX74_00880 [Fimbriimonadaceae bacterium]|nr:hypothetical protein [Fimbriimonadaceae bacterium]
MMIFSSLFCSTLLVSSPARLPAVPVQAPISVTKVRVVPGIRPVALAPAPQGSKFVACLEDGSVRIIDANTRATVRELAKHVQPAYAATWSLDGAWIATGDESGRIFIEDARNGARVYEYRDHTRGVQKVSFNRGRTALASTGKDDTIVIQEPAKATPAVERRILGNGANLYGAEYNPATLDSIATGILVDAGRVYDSRTGAVKSLLSERGCQGTFDVAFNRNGTRVVTAGRDGVSLVWDAAKNRRLARLVGHQDWAVYAAWSPSGRLIATSSTDRTVMIWNAMSYQRIATLSDQNSVGSPLCFTGDGKFLITTDVGGELQINAVTPSQPAVAAPAPVKKAPVKKAPAKKSPVKKGRKKRG